VASIAAAHAQAGAKEMRRFASVEGLTRVKLAPGTSLPAALAQYRKSTDVMYVLPNYYRRAQAVPNDTYFADGSLWGLQNIGQAGGTPGDDIHATAAWDLTTGSRDVVVMVIDSGIDYNHPDLKANMRPTYGINTVYQTSDPMDDTVDSHGTHVAGIIGAVDNNAQGVVGVAWQISLMASKAFDSNENGTDADIIACLDYAQTMKQRSLNLVATNNSYGGAPFRPGVARRDRRANAARNTVYCHGGRRGNGRGVGRVLSG
jgi:subtilisin family serine protease